MKPQDYQEALATVGRLNARVNQLEILLNTEKMMVGNATHERDTARAELQYAESELKTVRELAVADRQRISELTADKSTLKTKLAAAEDALREINDLIGRLPEDTQGTKARVIRETLIAYPKAAKPIDPARPIFEDLRRKAIEAAKTGVKA